MDQALCAFLRSLFTKLSTEFGDGGSDSGFAGDHHFICQTYN
jgi:hypothetical protein